MNLNYKYLDIKYGIGISLLYEIDKDFLGCSFSFEDEKIDIQFLFSKARNYDYLHNKMKQYLPIYHVNVLAIILTPEEFNNYDFIPLEHSVFEINTL